MAGGDGKMQRGVVAWIVRGATASYAPAARL